MTRERSFIMPYSKEQKDNRIATAIISISLLILLIGAYSPIRGMLFSENGINIIWDPPNIARNDLEIEYNILSSYPIINSNISIDGNQIYSRVYNNNNNNNSSNNNEGDLRIINPDAYCYSQGSNIIGNDSIELLNIVDNQTLRYKASNNNRFDTYFFFNNPIIKINTNFSIHIAIEITKNSGDFEAGIFLLSDNTYISLGSYSGISYIVETYNLSNISQFIQNSEKAFVFQLRFHSPRQIYKIDQIVLEGQAPTNNSCLFSDTNSFIIDTNNYADGFHTISIITQDQMGMQNTIEKQILFDNTPPNSTISIKQIENYLSIEANISDNFNLSSSILRVNYLNTSNIINETHYISNENIDHIITKYIPDLNGTFDFTLIVSDKAGNIRIISDSIDFFYQFNSSNDRIMEINYPSHVYINNNASIMLSIMNCNATIQINNESFFYEGDGDYSLSLSSNSSKIIYGQVRFTASNQTLLIRNISIEFIEPLIEYEYLNHTIYEEILLQYQKRGFINDSLLISLSLPENFTANLISNDSYHSSFDYNHSSYNFSSEYSKTILFYLTIYRNGSFYDSLNFTIEILNIPLIVINNTIYINQTNTIYVNNTSYCQILVPSSIYINQTYQIGVLINNGNLTISEPSKPYIFENITTNTTLTILFEQEGVYNFTSLFNNEIYSEFSIRVVIPSQNQDNNSQNCTNTNTESNTTCNGCSNLYFYENIPILFTYSPDPPSYENNITLNIQMLNDNASLRVFINGTLIASIHDTSQHTYLREIKDSMNISFELYFNGSHVDDFSFMIHSIRSESESNSNGEESVNPFTLDNFDPKIFAYFIPIVALGYGLYRRTLK